MSSRIRASRTAMGSRRLGMVIVFSLGSAPTVRAGRRGPRAAVSREAPALRPQRRVAGSQSRDKVGLGGRSSARFGLPLAALDVALRDEYVGTHVRTLIAELLAYPVPAAPMDPAPPGTRGRPRRGRQ